MSRIDAAIVKQQITNLFLEFPELQDDEDLRLDNLEGQTELFEVLAILVDDIQQAAAMQKAIGHRIDDLKSRLGRYEKQEEGWRRLVQQLMNLSSLRKMVLPEATLSIRAGAPAVRVIDQGFIPEEYWRVKREPNIAAIRDALKSGADVPGCTLSNNPETLSIRSK